MSLRQTQHAAPARWFSQSWCWSCNTKSTKIHFPVSVLVTCDPHSLSSLPSAPHPSCSSFSLLSLTNFPLPSSSSLPSSSLSLSAIPLSSPFPSFSLHLSPLLSPSVSESLSPSLIFLRLPPSSLFSPASPSFSLPSSLSFVAPLRSPVPTHLSLPLSLSLSSSSPPLRQL